MPDKFWMKLAWMVPKPLAYWCCIRVCSFATVEKYSDQIVPELTCLDAIKRWEN